VRWKRSNVVKWSDLFDGLGYTARCAQLSGTTVEIAGYVVDTHDSRDQVLVAEPGGCPHCSAVPAISLPDFRIEKKAEAVRLRGTLSYGFKVNSDGAGSFLRLEKARLT
jgi:hypothetical protein